ncbi:hypothetical protein [uncultured Pseudodesulfovibrio sp.]|uniref:hypothetical protein n=1 Tax=uncultured Pseudodesulfovibrio sp. TaxID=2035858 RepID=UPI0029C88508|nr:hypothetical protein [uncultured Pseudodesulfovibrio sp.]
MKSVTMDQLRDVIQRLTEGGKNTISNAMLYEALGFEDEVEKQRMRRRVTSMIKKSELIRISPGWYSYNPKAQPQRNGEAYMRVWRLVRSKNPGWSMHDMATVTRVSYTMVTRYCGWLLEEGYLARHGRKGNTRLYRATQKAKEQRDTPYPPIAPSDPFDKERSAACRLVRLMMERDLYQNGVRGKLLKELNILNKRFQEVES